MTVRSRTVPRQIKPELEHELARSPNLGYESSTEVGFVRCLSHGYPTPLARWHYHDEYELHLITSTSGKLFVGDWIGPFQAGQLVLTGPRLPHNWVSMDMPEGGVPVRDLVIQFTHEPLAQASETIPELREVLPLLERAKHGIEFFGLSESAEQHWHKVKGARGLKRFIAFCDFLSELATCTDYRLLSSVQLQSDDDDASIDQIHDVVSRITDHLADEHSAGALAAELGMSESKFSRFFRKATGNTFTDFVNRVRISRACQLLMDSDQQISHICYEVGFNNVANFNRRFLESKGMTPSEFRKQSLNRFRGAA
ncbi:AraC family transcriptional regulator [Hydrogenophaga aromaticivorans]|uniref:AraC family transcriptional regulator n=1 Tax=Hydrogenophaga aromaticivorans TaxID=2610898 RepID=UPI001B367AEE|nr:AraC family transcriptional regulator [Hydrogenophaga aromaticivorans]MBQ0917905.1 AraC family transcriptional regulator [Hydrogenophaga aromaticivorans]